MSKLITCTPQTPIRLAVNLMRNQEVGAVLAVQEERPVGLLTERDIVAHWDRSPQSTRESQVADIMTTDFQTIGVDYSLSDLIECVKQPCGRAVVVDDEEHAVAVLTIQDVLELLADEFSELAAAFAPRRIHLAPTRRHNKAA